MNKINLDEFNMSDAELFAPVNHDEFESERITAPRYSYWKSVFRVFFRKKINIVVLSILAILILFSYVYPAIIHYDADVNPYINIMDSTTKHLKPAAAMEKFGGGLKWILGSGASGESTFDAIWYGSSISISLALICASVGAAVDGLQRLPVKTSPVCLLVRKYMSECSHTLPLIVSMMAIGLILLMCVSFV